MEAMETASYGRSGDVASGGYIFPFSFIDQMRYVKIREEYCEKFRGTIWDGTIDGIPI